MKFLREIPLKDDKQAELIALHNYGFTLVWKEESVEIWANVKDTSDVNEVQKAA